ncbi:fibronectin type III-like domain-contianing protein [Lentzea sp. DG1S-22]|uniref:fibronectin type III-like domain-contianing protein n=1 Tax=Lentzea sp. DG1S-22 TaxID=3108822 RepID=UPI002E767452|nr:fibronectin type III-like domain-contianing protein [Lentzea sp. DG1S-22]WVH77465.1 fibronectin type III-like domain-contianing protein [Lentzea sp. DG1S-22]
MGARARRSRRCTCASRPPPVLTPDARLVAFTRVELAAGQLKQVEVSSRLSQLALTVGDGRREVARGGYEAVVGAAKAAFAVR